MMNKKVIAFILALGLVSAQVCTLPQSSVQMSTVSVSAETSGSFTYELLTDGTAKITGYTGTDSEPSIPTTLGGKTVSCIGSDAFASNTTVKKISIPSSVKTIGDRAFFGCRSLESITIAGSVTTIGEGAFSSCSSLKTVSLPSSVTSLGASAFAYCTSLSGVTIPSSIKVISDSAFENCTALTSVSLPSGITTIGSSAFWDCTKLASVTIPSSVTKVGTYAFGNTKWLTEQRSKNPVVVSGNILIDAKKYTGAALTVPASVKYIADGAFAMNDNIKQVVLAQGTACIGSYAFYECNSLMGVSFPSTLTSISDHAFYGCDLLGAAALPSGLKALGESTFAQCRSLKSVTLGDSLTSIPDKAFENCTLLQSIVLPASVQTIGAGSFAGCEKLGSVYLPGSLKTISSGAFINCSSLDRITVPTSVTSIGNKALGFDRNGESKISGFTVLCSSGTAAYSYAKSNGFATASLPAIERISGSDRYATAVAVSKKNFPSGAKTVIIASGLDYADALTGVPLANALGAPILLCSKNEITDSTLAEIDRLGAQKAVILGGTGAVSETVASAIKKHVSGVTRIAGSDRFETSAKIAAELTKTSSPSSVFFVYYNGFADALSASSIAAIKSAPIIYVKTNGGLDEKSAAYLSSVKAGIKNAYIIGGTSVISDNMKSSIEKALGKSTVRLSGTDRYSTCIAVNEHFGSELTGKSICIATGMNFPDALAGGVFAALQKSPLMLADKNLSQAQTAFLAKRKSSTVYALGGQGAVSDAVIRRVSENSI